MAGDLDLGISIKLNDRFSGGAGKVNSSLKKVQTGAVAAGTSMRNLGSAMRAAAGAAIFLAGKRALGAVFNAAEQFETSIAKVATLLDTSVVNTQELGETFQDLSKQFGIKAVDQASAFYKILASGITDVSEATEVLTTVNKLSVGAMVDQGTAIGIVTDVMDAWQLTAKDSEAIADSLFTTMKNGGGTVEELTGFFNTVGPAAAKLGIGIDDLFASEIALTKQGLSTTKSMRPMKALLTSLQNPSKDLAATFKKYKFASADAAIETLGFQGVLNLLSEESVKTKKPLKDLVGSTLAVDAVQRLTGKNAVLLSESMDLLRNKYGATTDAVNKVQETTEQKMKLLEARVDSLKVALGNRLVPVMEDVVEKAIPLIDKVEAWTEANPELTKGILLTVAALTALSAVLSAAAIAAFVLSAAMSPVALIILAVAAGIAGTIFIIWRLYESIKAVSDFMVNEVPKAWDIFKQKAATVAEAVSTSFQFVWGAIKDGFNNIKTGVGAAIDGTTALIKSKWTEVKTWILGIAGEIQAALTNAFSVSGIAGSVANWATQGISNIMNNSGGASTGTTSPVSVAPVGGGNNQQSQNVALGATQNPNINVAPPIVNTTVNVPASNINASDVIMDGKAIARIVWSMTQTQTVRSTA